MLINLHPGAAGLEHGIVPSSLYPLVDAAAGKLTLEEAVSVVTKTLGFASHVYGLTTSKTLTKDSRFYYHTSGAPQWIAEYDQNSYVESDPRVLHCWSHLTPLFWDRRIGGNNEKINHFLERAAEFGIGSGIAIALRDDLHSRAMFALNTPERDIDTTILERWAEVVGNIMLLAVHFHALFLKEYVLNETPPTHTGAPLSPRERQCLHLAARGQTSADIGFKLGITERTVIFHFSNIISKLNAVNRAEAIAIAISRGIVER